MFSVGWERYSITHDSYCGDNELNAGEQQVNSGDDNEDHQYHPKLRAGPFYRSSRVLNEFGQFACRNTPLRAHFECRQFFAVDQVMYSVGRQIQQFSGLAWSQEWQRTSLLLHV